METLLVLTTGLWLTTRHRGFTFVRLSDPYLLEVRPRRFDPNAHHHGSLPQQLGVVWNPLLEADSEGPAFISYAALTQSVSSLRTSFLRAPAAHFQSASDRGWRWRKWKRAASRTRHRMRFRAGVSTVRWRRRAPRSGARRARRRHSAPPTRNRRGMRRRHRPRRGDPPGDCVRDFGCRRPRPAVWWRPAPRCAGAGPAGCPSLGR
ncbi:hypothetical protein F1193_14225 [Blastochloris sulfoviridis]|uniref:Uncharacterized protein n=1 Tax=Blastochloris sulfoviridis TaxID=50712 RepID=A0A5M6HN65_9HYPH|nr:hypothetical protein F1193_14225 [Blastochloris sulfoviridis]